MTTMAMERITTHYLHLWHSLLLTLPRLIIMMLKYVEATNLRRSTVTIETVKSKTVCCLITSYLDCWCSGMRVKKASYYIFHVVYSFISQLFI